MGSFEKYKRDLTNELEDVIKAAGVFSEDWDLIGIKNLGIEGYWEAEDEHLILRLKKGTGGVFGYEIKGSKRILSAGDAAEKWARISRGAERESASGYVAKFYISLVKLHSDYFAKRDLERVTGSEINWENGR